MNRLISSKLNILGKNRKGIIAIIVLMFFSLLAAPLSFGTDKFPADSKVGYLENLNYNEPGGRITPKFDLANEHGYNIIVVAFANVQKTQRLKPMHIWDR